MSGPHCLFVLFYRPSLLPLSAARQPVTGERCRETVISTTVSWPMRYYLTITITSAAVLADRMQFLPSTRIPSLSPISGKAYRLIPDRCRNGSVPLLRMPYRALPAILQPTSWTQTVTGWASGIQFKAQPRSGSWKGTR